MVVRHQFLTNVHELLKPKTYLEIGVQHGDSLRLATFSERVIGVDPEPLCRAQGNQTLHAMTADDYFSYLAGWGLTVDLAYIDGSHLFEDALRDFMNVEMHSHPGTVVLFDDVLPMTQEIGGRHMVPGYWAGDVWKLDDIFATHRPDLHVALVATEACTSRGHHPAGIVCAPTGTMVVWGLDRGNAVLPNVYDWLLDLRSNTTVPEAVLRRSRLTEPENALATMAAYLKEMP